MILKGSQRANGGDLAIHLMNGFDNESVELAELRGAVADDLSGAFAEFEAVAAGTRAEKYLYSLSINPHEPLTRDQYMDAIGVIEDRLGLADQPRAVVFHVKPDGDGVGREHCHVVWSRIDIAAMKAIHLSHDKSKLMDCACDLAHRFGHELPPGLKAWDEKRPFKKDKLEPSLAEKAQTEESGITPEQRREEITAAYEQADGAEAFRAALDGKGYVLARGDKRGFVVIDQQCDVHSLTRYVKGHKAREIKAKLAGIDPADLPSVDQAKQIMRDRLTRDRGEGQAQAGDDQGEAVNAEKIAQMREALERELAGLDAARRAAITEIEQELLTRQQGERMQLHAAQLSESRRWSFRFRRKVADLIDKTPGLRSVLGPLQKKAGLNPADRHKAEKDALATRHDRERADIERRKRAADRLATRERQSLEKRLAREVQEARKLEQTARQAQDRQVEPTEMKRGDLREGFNDAAEFAEGIELVDDDGEEEQALSWNERERQLDERRGQRKGNRRGRKGRGYRRDDDD